MNGRVTAAALARRDGSTADGVHLLWTAPAGAGWSLDGWTIRRRKVADRPKVQCFQLAPSELEALHRFLRLQTSVALFTVRQAASPQPPPGVPAAAREPFGTVSGVVCVAYEIDLPERHRVLEVDVGTGAALAIALRDGKAVAARLLTSPLGVQSVVFEGLDADGAVVYCSGAASSLQVCLDQPSPDEDKQWENTQPIAAGIQVPIRALDSTLGSQADEDAVAKSRLLDGEVFDEDAFHDVADLMNAAAADAANVAPVWLSIVTREAPDDPFLELRPWPYALALLTEPPWRRMLGFGYLDRAGELEPGAVYDYRVSGFFRRRDLEEPLHGFHLVPRGTTLPTAFALGPIALLSPAPLIVRQLPEPPADALQATGRKGVALAGEACLTLSFAAPVTRVALEVGEGASLRWKASTTDFLPGLPINQFGGDLPPQRRVTIETADPVDTITLSGTGFLFGVRELLSAPGTSPDDVVEASATLYGVVFADTPKPEPPPFLDTVSLQQPSLPTDPAAGPPPAPASLGFWVSWLPPPAAGADGPVPWPADLGAFPPFDVLGFRLQRRRVDTGGDFEELDGKGTSTLVLGSRGARADPPALAPGVDLEAVFADDGPPVPPVSPLMALDDVLVRADHSGPPPGSTHQYRAFSVDAIGRVSGTAAVGPVVRLEKRQPPPQPVGSPEPPPAGAVVPAGVRARVLQADDLDLGPADRQLLGTSRNAVVLEWGWTQRERDGDSFATEFRVYWQPLAPDVVSGAVTGPPTLVGGLFLAPAAFDRPLEADAMRGRYLALPDYPFKVAGHDAGQDVALRLEPSVLDPARAPGPAAFEFRPVLGGSEQRPPAWAERAAVVPIGPQEAYRFVLRDRLALDAENSRARAWIGVSAADEESYVDDALPGGGRPGNESAIAASAVTARHLGRPELTVPPPLPDVPELVTAEPAGDTVTVVIDLPALLPDVAVPAGHQVQLERLALGRVVTCLSANADATIGVRLPDGTVTSYTLANPGDQAALLAQIRSGTAASIEGRFLVDFVVRFGPQLEPLWVAVLPDPVPFGALSDTLPADAERHLHRIRLADAARHLSAGSAIAPQIVRVPSLRSPAPPELAARPGDGEALAVTARVRDAFDLSWVVVFAADEDAALTPNGNLRDPAQLLRLPSRRDLYPNDGVRVRLADGTLLAPATVLDAEAGSVEVPDRVLSGALTPGPRRRVALWGIAMTRDGIPSRLTGPVTALTGPASTEALG